MSEDDAKIVLLLLGVVGGIVTFIVGLWQYGKAQRWKVLEFVAGEIKEFEADEHVRNVMYMLDYHGREFDLIPGKPPVPVDERLIVDSLVVRQTRALTDEELAIRDSFDAFFERLERFDQYVETGLVRYEDFHPYLRYWLAMLTNPRVGFKSPRLVDAVREFAETFQYDGMLRLLGRYLKQSRPLIL